MFLSVILQKCFVSTTACDTMGSQLNLLITDDLNPLLHIFLAYKTKMFQINVIWSVVSTRQLYFNRVNI